MTPRSCKVAVLLLGARTTDGALSLAALKELRRRNAYLVVYVCTRWDSVVPAHAPHYARAGADGLFTIGTPSDVVDLMGMVSEVIEAPPPAAELSATRQMGLSGWPLLLTEHALRNACRRAPLADVAEHFGRQLRTIGDYLAHAAHPCLSDLFRCGRYLHLEELKRRGVHGVRELARRTGFATDTEICASGHGASA